MPDLDMTASPDSPWERSALVVGAEVAWIGGMALIVYPMAGRREARDDGE